MEGIIDLLNIVVKASDWRSEATGSNPDSGSSLTAFVGGILDVSRLPPESVFSMEILPLSGRTPR